MNIYNYDPVTKEFLSVEEADKSPLEPDVYLFPANSTTIATPSGLEKHKTPCFNIETKQWSIVDDYREVKLYSKETKEAAVRDYLSHEFTFPEILKKYQIRSGTQLKKWIKKYNGCEVLKSSGTGGNNIMTTGRKTTFDERIEIVQYCIAHDHNYAETAEEYQVSYQQARNYTIKYESKGVEALKDNRGKRKSLDSMSELEKLRAEVKILRAEKEHAEMEVAFLKKLEEIERRRG